MIRLRSRVDVDCSPPTGCVLVGHVDAIVVFFCRALLFGDLEVVNEFFLDERTDDVVWSCLSEC